MSEDGFDDDFDDGFGFFDDMDYQDDDDLSALVDSMAETAFAQGDPVWDEFEAEYDTTEYHSDWSYYSDGGFYSDEEKAPAPVDGAGKPPLNDSPQNQEQTKVTATVIVPLPPTPPTPPRKFHGSESNKTNGVSKEDANTLSSTSIDGFRAAMKRKPSTDEALTSP